MGSAESHYNVVDLAKLESMPILDISAKNCALCLWTTGPMMDHAVKLMRAWGFEYKTVLFVWVKTRQTSDAPVLGQGFYTRSSCEYILLGIRGQCAKMVKNHKVEQLVMSPREHHSKKPDCIRAFIDKLFGTQTKKIELFARNSGSKYWDVWGKEAIYNDEEYDNEDSSHSCLT